ncbi:MAG: hypothetical protein V7K48_11455 [Nostoc sp.]|uniref:hypothetical protein n=1 Tax=Nostoc sp. TaxID=1180 RepID=UPI002FF4D30D
MVQFSSFAANYLSDGERLGEWGGNNGGIAGLLAASQSKRWRNHSGILGKLGAYPRSLRHSDTLRLRVVYRRRHRS